MIRLGRISYVNMAPVFHRLNADVEEVTGVPTELNAMVLDGRLASLPLADTGPLSRGTVRLDAAQGIMGLRVLNSEGLLADPARREALAMALERETLLAPFNIAGWTASTRLPSTARTCASTASYCWGHVGSGSTTLSVWSVGCAST